MNQSNKFTNKFIGILLSVFIIFGGYFFVINSVQAAHIPTNSSCTPGTGLFSKGLYNICKALYCALNVYDPECGFVAPAQVATPVTPTPVSSVATNSGSITTPVTAEPTPVPASNPCNGTFYHLTHPSECGGITSNVTPSVKITPSGNITPDIFKIINQNNNKGHKKVF